MCYMACLTHTRACFFQTKWGFTLERTPICSSRHGYPVIQIHQRFPALEYDMIGSHTLLIMRFCVLPDCLPLLGSFMLDWLCSLFFSRRKISGNNGIQSQVTTSHVLQNHASSSAFIKLLNALAGSGFCISADLTDSNEPYINHQTPMNGEMPQSYDWQLKETLFSSFKWTIRYTFCSVIDLDKNQNSWGYISSFLGHSGAEKNL